jgi:acyl-CoA reductase-like NAD-dependent aldehyde dehydrogenase
MAEATALAVATPNLFQTVNPATGEKGPAYQGRTVDQALSIAADVHRAQIAWRRTGFKERAPLTKNAAKVIRDNSLRYTKLRWMKWASRSPTALKTVLIEEL